MIPPQVEGFVAVARDGTLRGAAASLHITQPALTARIQGLETELGTTLFRRHRKGMELNHAGRAFLPYAERALESLRGGSALVAELAEGVAGELAIGAVPTVGTYVLPVLLARFRNTHPKVRLVVRTGHSERLIEMVLQGEVELAITRDLRDQRVTARPLYEDELILVASPEHRFASARRVDVSAIHHEPLILFDRASSYYELTNALFRAAGVVPRSVLEVDSIDAAKRMAQMGIGVALLPGTAVADSLEAGTLAEIGLRGATPIRRRFVAVEHLGGRSQPPVVADFASLLSEVSRLIPRAQRIRRRKRSSTQAR